MSSPKKIMLEIKTRRSELQAEHETAKEKLDCHRKRREESSNPWDLEMLLHEKALQDQACQSFIEFSQAVAGEHEAEIARLTNRNPLDSKGVKSVFKVKARRVLPFKKRTQRVKLTSRKEFFQKCKDMQAMFSREIKLPVLEEKTTKAEKFSNSATVSLPDSLKPDPESQDPDPPEKTPKMEKCEPFSNSSPTSWCDSSKPDPESQQDPDPPGIYAEVGAS